MSMLDRVSAQALNEFYQRQQEREADPSVSRVLLKVNYDNKGKVYLTAEDEGEWGLLQRFAFFFSHEEYTLKRIARFLEFKQENVAISKALPAIRVIDQKIVKHNSGALAEPIVISKKFEE